MSNSFGNIFRFTTWGESHGKAIGCVVDGVPSQIELSEADIQPFLDARKPGLNKFTTQRQEDDRVEILSGVFEGKTTGTPISLIIYNQDQRSKDYSEIKDQYRPGHADYVYDEKYGFRDYRGGGRSSARETAMRVAAGAIARKIIAKFQPDTLPAVKITAALTEMGEISLPIAQDWDLDEINNNPFFCPHADTAKKMEPYLAKIRKNGSSVGAMIEVRAKNIQVGIGEPIYNKLDQAIASAMMSINAVKSVEIGIGADAARMQGEYHSDQMRAGKKDKNGKIHPEFLSNNAGGILGGISSGQEIIARFAVKPTSSMLIPMQSIDRNGNEIDVITKGRHDPCVGIRAVPVAEAMMACVLADQIMLHRARFL